MEFVTDVLKECFDLDPEASRDAMLRIHQTGASVVGTYDAVSARGRVTRARETARSKLMPLRITTQQA